MTPTIAAGIWAAGIVLWLVIRWPYRRRARRLETVTDKRSRTETTLLGLTIIGLVVLPIINLTSNVLDFAQYRFTPIFAWLGFLAIVSFLVLFHLSHKGLAKNWSVSLEIRKGHTLVDTGIYKTIRHPMYSSFWLWGIGQAFLIPNWIAGLSGLLSVALLYFCRVNAEEEMMRQQFGAEYDAYCARTHRLFPKLF